MATDYGYGIRSSHGNLTFNGVDYRQLDFRALNAMRQYLENIPEPPTHHKHGISIFGHSDNGKWNNWRSEISKVGQQLNTVRRTTDPMVRSNSWNSLLGPGGTAAMRGMTHEQVRTQKANYAGQVLQSIAPQYQALQAAPQEGQPGVATGGTMASASRAYANLISRQRNLSQLGV